MAEISLRQVALYATALLVVVGLGVRHLSRDDGSPASLTGSAPAAAIRVQAADDGSKVTVHVAGAVRRPGVYALKAGSRIDDAVARAGGATARADLSAVNLAAKAEDGRQVLVPPRIAAPSPGTADASAAARTTGTGSPAVAPVSLTSATLEQLDALDGIGPATAQAILDQREERGGFGTVEELAQVPGVGPKRMATLRDQVRP